MHSAAMDDQENTIDDTVLDNKDIQSVFTGNSTAPTGSTPLTEQLQKVMKRLEEVEPTRPLKESIEESVSWK